MIITIDGLSASGKCALAKKLSVHFNIPYLDSGKIYRHVAVAITKHNLSTSCDMPLILEIIRNLDCCDMQYPPSIHSEKVGSAASKIAMEPLVRFEINLKQKQFAHGKLGAVIDGRDSGTAICPEANYKFYTYASVSVRAKRRYKELHAGIKGAIYANYANILRAIIRRDLRDKSRKCDPARVPAGAIVIDTSLMDPTDVFKLASSYIKIK